jgi:hypothetical protein
MHPLARFSGEGSSKVLVAGLMAIGIITAFSSYADSEQTVTGELEVLHGDNFKEHKTVVKHLVKTADHKKVRVQYKGPAPDLKQGDKVEMKGRKRSNILTVPTVRKKGYSQSSKVKNEPQPVDTKTAHLQLKESAGPAPPASGAHKVAVILFNFTNDKTETDADHREVRIQDVARQDIFTSQTSVNAYYKESSSGKLSLTGRDRPDGDIYGWYTIPYDNGNCMEWDDKAQKYRYQLWGESAVKKAGEARANISGYDNYIFIFPNNSSCSWSGTADLGGQNSFINSYDTRIIAHEFGHNVGFYHSRSVSCTDDNGTPISNPYASVMSPCKIDEYGDPFDVMGGAYSSDYGRLNAAPHKKAASWLPQDSIQTVTTSGIYTLKPSNGLEAGTKVIQYVLPQHDFGNTPGLDTYYYSLEYRKNTGKFDVFNEWDSATIGVSIRTGAYNSYMNLIDTTPDVVAGYYPAADSALTPGHSYRDPDSGFSVTTLSVTPTSASVAIQIASPAAPVFRFYNPHNGTHFFTQNIQEAFVVWSDPNWVDEGYAGAMYSKQEPGTVPLERFYSPRTGDHFFTANPAEANGLKHAAGWNYEGIAAYVLTGKGEGTTEIYRYYNPRKGFHFFTTNAREREVLRGDRNWVYEGIADYTFPY